MSSPISEQLNKLAIDEKSEQKVELVTNNYDVQLEEKNVYRYDVEVTMFLGGVQFPTKRIELTALLKEEATKNKQAACTAILQEALRLYFCSMFQTSIGVVYNGAKLMYTSEPLFASDEGRIFQRVNTKTTLDNIQKLLNVDELSHFEVYIVKNGGCPEFKLGQKATDGEAISQNQKYVNEFLNLLTGQNSNVGGKLVIGMPREREQQNSRNQDVWSVPQKGFKLVENNGNGNQVAPTLVMNAKRKTNGLEKPIHLTPEERFTEIGKMMNEMKGDDKDDDILGLFGVKISTKPKTVEAVRRALPSVVFNQGRAVMNHQKLQWSSRGSRAVSPGKAEKVFLAFDRSYEKVARETLKTLSDECENFGIEIKKWELVPIDNLTSSYKQINDVLKEAKTTVSTNDTLLILIDNNENSHKNLKLAERRNELIAQHLTLKKAKILSKQSETRSTFVKKLNLKLGGLNYRVEPQGVAKEKWEGNVLIMSYDVSHPGAGNPNSPMIKPSVVGFSYNCGNHRESFIGDFHYQKPNQEQVESSILHSRTKYILEQYVQQRKCYPEHVLIIRDGVSESQYDMVVTEELEAIKKACNEIGLQIGFTWEPKFSLVVATKRHANRLFTENQGKIGNVQPGTSVHKNMNRQNVTETLLFSTHATQGTSRPVNYQLLINNFFEDQAEFDSYILALTFHHQICNNSIRLPEPVYQADEWASRGKQLFEAFDELFKMPLAANGKIDYDSLTKKLSFRFSKLNQKRINA